MRKHTELRLEPWTVILAVVLMALIGFMLSRMGGMKPMEMNSQAMIMEFMNGVDEALKQLDVASTHVGEAVKAPDVSALQEHLQLAKDVLAGQGGVLMRMQMMQEMLQGPMMSMEHHTNMMTALQAVLSTIKSALEHFDEALKATELETAQEHARFAAEQLRAAKGSSGSSDPKTGGLTYIKEQMTQMMGQMKGK